MILGIVLGIVILGGCAYYLSKTSLTANIFGYEIGTFEHSQFLMNRKTGTIIEVLYREKYSYFVTGDKGEIPCEELNRDYIPINPVFHFKKHKIILHGYYVLSKFHNNIYKNFVKISQNKSVWNSCQFTLETIIQNLEYFTEERDLSFADIDRCSTVLRKIVYKIESSEQEADRNMKERKRKLKSEARKDFNRTIKDLSDFWE